MHTIEECTLSRLLHTARDIKADIERLEAELERIKTSGVEYDPKWLKPLIDDITTKPQHSIEHLAWSYLGQNN